MKSSNSSDISFHITKQTNRNMKYFIYRDKKYPINFNLLINNCNYFYRNRKQYKDIEDIKLLNDDEERIILSDEAIQAFISTCQNEKCQIKLSSIIPLHYLSYKFEYPELQAITDKYIEDHSDELVIQTLLFNPAAEKEEEIISSNFSEFIKNDQILQLPISTLDRIFQNYKKSKTAKKIDNNEIIIFLFKCLDRYGKDTSILFNDVDFQEENVGVVNRLLNEYSNDFDFNMINSTLAKTTLKLTSELTKQKEEFAKFFNEMKDEFEKQRLEVVKIRDEEKKARIEEEKKYRREIEKLNCQINQRMKSIENDFGQISQQYEKNIENGKVAKYQKILLEILINEFDRLSDESKLHMIEEINENQQIMINDDNEFIQKVACLSNLYKILASNDKIKPLFKFSRQELLNFVVSNMNSQFNINADVIEYLGQLNILPQVLKDICNKYEQICIEITYPMKSFQSTANLISNIRNEIKQNSDKIIYKLTINENPKPEEMNAIRHLIKELKINPSAKAINDSIFNDFGKLIKVEIMDGITAIGKKSFQNCLLLNKISIPSSVKSIGDSAFEGCTSLTKISIPSSVKSIGKSIFKGCKTITLSKSMTSIPSNLFNGCTSLTEISIPSSVKSIGDSAFEGCTSLTEISIPSSVNSIGKSIFKGCKTITLSKSMTSIPSNLFNGCTSLTEISIPSSVKSIGDSAFEGCTSLTEISIPSSVKSIGKSIFKGCKTITLSKSMTSIPSNLFNGCTSLTEISIPSSVKSIGDSAFEGCTSLVKITIPSSVKSIGKSAFKNCPGSLFKPFVYSQGGELNGVIRYLTNRTGGNIHNNGKIAISASSSWGGDRNSNVNVANLCDFNVLSQKSMWTPATENNSTLLFDFKDQAIQITDYTLHTPSDLSGSTPKSWVVECSNDMDSWATVDTRNDEAVMNNQNVCHTFKCQSQSDNFYRYIRFKSTGNNYYFDISAVEFFGVLKESSQ